MALWISYVKAWIEEQTGQDLAEYALLIGLIAIAVVVGAGLLGDNINAFFDMLATEIGGWTLPG